MKYLLDTCVISDFIRGVGHTTDRFKNTPPSKIAISAITQMELYYGVQLQSGTRKNYLEAFITDVIKSVYVIPFDSKIALKTASLRADLKSNGTPIGAYDLLIGATAITYGLTLVTSNLKEFERIKSISIENWRDKK